MFLSNRSNGVYYLWYFNNASKLRKISTGCTLKVEAQQFLKEFISKGRVEAQTLETVTLIQFFGEYLSAVNWTAPPA